MDLGYDSDVYDQVIVPNLHRMMNLEKLVLYLVIDCKETFIDGNNLKNKIYNHMPLLHEFGFNIRSTILFCDGIHLLSNEDIQRTFKNFEDYEVISSVDYFPNERSAQCHIYSYPYTLQHYDKITNHFPGGLFNCVQIVTLFDGRPFEHEFFMLIAQAFPFLKDLTIDNSEPQKYKHYSNSNDDNRVVPVITYSHLIKLRMYQVHDDYVEQFLLDTKTCFLNDIHLSIYNDVLKRVTHNFTRDATLKNYSNVKSLWLYERTDLSKYL